MLDYQRGVISEPRYPCSYLGYLLLPTTRKYTSFVVCIFVMTVVTLLRILGGPC